MTHCLLDCRKRVGMMLGLTLTAAPKLILRQESLLVLSLTVPSSAIVQYVLAIIESIKKGFHFDKKAIELLEVELPPYTKQLSQVN